VVVGPGGGLLRRLILPARLGFGARFGDGSQFMSWISLADAVGAVLHAAGEEALSGPVNVTVSTAVTNRSFARTLSCVLGRSGIGFAPKWALDPRWPPTRPGGSAVKSAGRASQAAGDRFRLPVSRD